MPSERAQRPSCSFSQSPLLEFMRSQVLEHFVRDVAFTKRLPCAIKLIERHGDSWSILLQEKKSPWIEVIASNFNSVVADAPIVCFTFLKLLSVNSLIWPSYHDGNNLTLGNNRKDSSTSNGFSFSKHKEFYARTFHSSLGSFNSVVLYGYFFTRIHHAWILK